MEQPGSVTLMSLEELKRRVRADMAGSNLVNSLLADRREEAAADCEDAGDAALAQKLRAEAQELRAKPDVS
jgi:hypothetical protein